MNYKTLIIIYISHILLIITYISVFKYFCLYNYIPTPDIII